MGCVQLNILEQQYKRTELKVSYRNKELTLKNTVLNERSNILIRFIDPDGMWPWEAKNVREARKEARRTDGVFEKWKSENNSKTYASVDYRTSQEGRPKDAIGAGYAKVFNPKGQSWAEAYNNTVGEFVKDGSNDMANSGGTTKEGWMRATTIVGTMASGGTLIEAEGVLAITLSTVGLVNSIDDLGQNNIGEGIISQNISSPQGKDIVSTGKEAISVVNAATSVSNINKTIKSPFTLTSMFSDLKSLFKNDKKQ